MTPAELRGAALDLRGRAAALETQETAVTTLVAAHLSVDAWVSHVADRTRRDLASGEHSAAARLGRAADALRLMASDLEDRADKLADELAAAAATRKREADEAAGLPGPARVGEPVATTRPAPTGVS